jgi:4-hydroxy-tetrahydrodipicolinate synthase
MEAATTLALAEVPNIVGIKEASGNLDQITHIIRERPPHFAVVSGDDAITLQVMAAGGDGVISVVANATPRLMVRLVELCRDRRDADAQRTHEQLLPWMRAAFLESNPIPVKAALAMLGRVEDALRLPLVPLAQAYHASVRDALNAAGALTA